jgi:predicted AAA+ superfamily ATPase
MSCRGPWSDDTNFEDERLWDVDARDLGELLEAFYRRTPDHRLRRSTLVLDEVQNVPGWERFVRRVLDSEDVRVILTGSSAKLLSGEIATSLRGRALATELFPFDFGEALVHRSGSELAQRPGKQRRSQVEAELDRYLQRGGFPEVQDVEESLRRRILQDYLQVALLRDIIERHEVTSALPPARTR